MTLAERRSTYMDLRFVLPTSNSCEKISWASGYTLNDREQSFLPSNIEMQVFLYANRALCALDDVYAVQWKVFFNTKSFSLYNLESLFSKPDKELSNNLLHLNKLKV